MELYFVNAFGFQSIPDCSGWQLAPLKSKKLDEDLNQSLSDGHHSFILHCHLHQLSLPRTQDW